MTLQNTIAILAIGIASNLDNAGVGISYGVRKIRISWIPNFIIAFISFLATLLAGLAGNQVSHWMAPDLGNLIGTIIIVAVGIWVLLQPFLEKKSRSQENHPNLITRILRKPEEADLDKSKTISVGESFILGIALAMNALAGGFDAGVTNLSVIFTSLAVGVFSFTLLGLTAYLGEKYAADKIGDQATVISGILLILIGLHQMF